MTNKLLLIDGHNLLVQMFYGMPNKMEGKNGKSIEGIWGFTGALLKMISQTNPTHICVIFEKEETDNQFGRRDGSHKKSVFNFTRYQIRFRKIKYLLFWNRKAL